MKNLFILLVVCSTFSAAHAQTAANERYSYVRIHLRAEQDLERLQRLGLDLDHASGKRRRFVEIFLQPQEIARVAANGFAYVILIADWDQHYAARKKFSAQELRALQKQSQVQDFRLGSMAGFYTFDEVVATLDSLRRRFPQLISEKFSIGKTVENRDIWAVKISSSPDAPRDKPEVFYNALIHAREPEGMMVLMYFMHYLLERYSADPAATYLLDNRELYFVPALNPDGYVYNQTSRPNGGGLWRKNRRANLGGSFGVDLNRNFGFKWGFNNLGSSGTPANETYRGVAPFSEPEIQAVRDFCRSRQFKVALNYHTFGNLFIYPFGFDSSESPDSALFRDFARDATAKNSYTYGNASQTVNYFANGAADDWMYGEQAEKPKIISSTIEAGTSRDGFWPLPSRIIPLAEENLHSNLHAAWIAGAYVVPTTPELSQEFPQAGDQITLAVKLQNKGLVAPDAPPTLEITTASTYLEQLSAASFEVQPGYREGEYAGLDIKLHQDGAASTTTFSFQLGAGKILLADDAETGGGLWRFSGGWGRDSSFAYQGKFSFKDRPHANSQNAAEAEMTLLKPLDCTNLASAKLQFVTQYAIESGADFGQVLASTDGGGTWQVLKGAYMGPGNGNQQQPFLEPGYDGIRHQWEKEEINLEAFAGKPNVLLKFRYRSDFAGNWRGWYVDNIRVIGYAADATGVAEARDGKTPFAFALAQNYPNPLRINAAATIRFSLPQRGRATLKIMDVLGREIATLIDGRVEAGNHTAVFETRNLPSGIYFYQLAASGFIAKKKMLLIH